MVKDKETFLLVMPVLNEEDYIENSISTWLPIIDKLPGSEILVIEGSSTDKTIDILKTLKQKLSYLTVVNQTDKGHGNALFQAYDLAVNSTHHWIFQTDGDGHHDPSDFNKLWKNGYLQILS